MTPQNQDTQQLMTVTLQGLQGDVTTLAPLANDLIEQWNKVLGEGYDTRDDVADELYQLKRVLAEGKIPQIASSLHTLCKLTRRAADTADEDTAAQLRQLADTLDDASARIAQSR